MNRILKLKSLVSIIACVLALSTSSGVYVSNADSSPTLSAFTLSPTIPAPSIPTKLNVDTPSDVSIETNSVQVSSGLNSLNAIVQPTSKSVSGVSGQPLGIFRGQPAVDAGNEVISLQYPKQLLQTINVFPKPETVTYEVLNNTAGCVIQKGDGNSYLTITQQGQCDVQATIQKSNYQSVTTSKKNY